MKNSWQSLYTLAEQAWQQKAKQAPLEHLTITRVEAPVDAMRVVYRPSLCVVLAGAKQSTLGNKSYRYAAGECLLASMHVPVSASILDASPQQPYLAFALTLDPIVVSELISHLNTKPQYTEPLPSALSTSSIPQTLIDPLSRLLKLVQQADDIPVLAPLAEKEIIWRLLHSELAPQVVQIGIQESHTARIGRATSWLRAHFREPIRVNQLAAQANMSVASFHRHFKAMTQFTPVQYQKQIRLQQARALLLAEKDVASIGFSVGYESASQFNRDYRRLFGVAPGQDRQRLREQLQATAGNM